MRRQGSDMPRLPDLPPPPTPPTTRCSSPPTPRATPPVPSSRPRPRWSPAARRAPPSTTTCASIAAALPGAAGPGALPRLPPHARAGGLPPPRRLAPAPGPVRRSPVRLRRPRSGPGSPPWASPGILLGSIAGAPLVTSFAIPASGSAAGQQAGGAPVPADSLAGAPNTASSAAPSAAASGAPSIEVLGPAAAPGAAGSPGSEPGRAVVQRWAEDGERGLGTAGRRLTGRRFRCGQRWHRRIRPAQETSACPGEAVGAPVGPEQVPVRCHRERRCSSAGCRAASSARPPCAGLRCSPPASPDGRAPARPTPARPRRRPDVFRDPAPRRPGSSSPPAGYTSPVPLRTVRPMERLLLLDGNGLIYRGYFALIDQPLTTSKGELVTAVFGFTNIVLRAIQDVKPDHIAVAFDLGKPTFRHERYADYKAHPHADAGRHARADPEGPGRRQGPRHPGLRARGLRGGRRHRHARRPGRGRRPRRDDPHR